jgi:CarD family transcriptional regulator
VPVQPAAKPVLHKPLTSAKPDAAKPAPAKPTVAAKPGHANPGLLPLAARPIAVNHGVPARAVPAAVAKTGAPRLTAPIGGAAPASPRAIAEKAAAARQAIAVQKKPVNQRHGFKMNEFIVYPAHGVGRIVGIEEQEIAGMTLELFVINFEKEKLTLRVPTGKLTSVGMRKLADDGIVKKAMETLKGRARIKRTMWSRRAQEYVAKINSGDLVSIAEVVRDLYRSEAQPEQSYSERQLYEDALDRMARELAAVEKLDDRGAVQRIVEVLSKSARGRRIAEGERDDSSAAEVKAA